MAIFIDETLLDAGEEADMKASDHNEREVKLVVEYC